MNGLADPSSPAAKASGDGGGGDDGTIASAASDEPDFSDALARLPLWIEMVDKTRNDDERDPDAFAAVLASLIGNDVMTSVLRDDNLSIVNQLRANFPPLIDQEGFLAQVINAARSMYTLPLEAPARPATPEPRADARHQAASISAARNSAGQ